MDKLQTQLEKTGFKYWDHVVGRTPFKDFRGNEIKEWLDYNPEVKHYVVVDDEPFDICGNMCSAIPEEKVVSIDATVGLTHVDSVKILNKLDIFL